MYYHMPTNNQPIAPGSYTSPPGAVYVPPGVTEMLPHNTIMTTASDVNGNYCGVQMPVFSNPGQNQQSSTAISFVPVDGNRQGQTSCGENSSNSANTGSSCKIKSVGAKGISDKENKQKSSTENCQNVEAHRPAKECFTVVSDRSKDKTHKECEKSKEDKEVNRKNAVEDDGVEQMDAGSDGDSGCPSECTDLSPAAVPDGEFADTTTAAPDSTSTTVEITKPRGKRRYYMYGNHKLIKPIKEIPQRFQTLLSETRAAKARCEGQPIYMQHSAVQQPYDIVYYQPTDESQQQQSQMQQLQQQPLNANANCFVPGQGGEAGMGMMGDDYTMCSTDYSGTTPSLQPTPLFVPPPPMPNPTPSNTSQSCPTIIVYSNASSSSSYLPQTSMVYARPSQPVQHVQSIPMAPPPYPPPPAIPPPPVESSTQTIYSPIAAMPKPACSTIFPTPIASNELDKKKPTKPISLNLTPQYNNANVRITQHTPSSIQTTPTLLPMLTNVYSKPPANPTASFPTPMAVDNNSTPQPFAPPPPSVLGNSPASLHVPSVSCASNVCMSQQPGRGANSQYMYVYPSTPTGVPPSNPPQGTVMYMVSPAAYSSPTYPSQNFQQQGLIMPSLAAQ